MASTQQILSAITGMQSGIQEGLAFHPNNGNPGGAYNMPLSQQPQQAGAAPAAPALPWLAPSSQMNSFIKFLNERQGQLDQQLALIRQQPLA